MPTVAHIEKHFTGTALVRDLVIGMSDGLTVPFALAAGISGAVSSSHIVVVAGLAEIVAGSIAMGLGGYLAAKSDAEHYESERKREEFEIVKLVDDEVKETRDIFQSYGLTEEETVPVIASLQKRPASWVDFMMRFELGLERPDPKRALTSAITIAGAYVAGGFIPLLPHCVAGFLVLCVRHPGCSGRFWLYQGTLHRGQAFAQRLADRGDWRPGRGSCISHRQADLLTTR
jgi:VIT1/CCC1 family predicted Fe2+/Mn2+ transporter